MPLVSEVPLIEESPTSADLLGASIRHGKITGNPLSGEFTILRAHTSLGETVVSSLSGEVVVMRPRSLRPSMLRQYRFDIRLAMESIEQFFQVLGGDLVQQGAPASHLSSPLSTNVRSTTVTPAAEQYARSLGLYGALVLTKGLIRKTIPSMKALNVEKKEDPDEEGYSTICFTITIPESVDRALEFDDALQDMLYDRLPHDALFYFTFIYRFE